MSGFTLAGLLRLRQVQEDRAAAELGYAERERARREERVAATGERLAASHLPPEAEASSFLAATASRLTLHALLDEETQEAAAAARVATTRRAEWTSARRAERSVERLEEHHEARERAAELRSEQQALDEVAGRAGVRAENREEER